MDVFEVFGLPIEVDLSFAEIQWPVLYRVNGELQPISDSDFFIDIIQVFFYGLFTDA